MYYSVIGIMITISNAIIAKAIINFRNSNFALQLLLTGASIGGQQLSINFLYLA